MTALVLKLSYIVNLLSTEVDELEPINKYILESPSYFLFPRQMYFQVLSIICLEFEAFETTGGHISHLSVIMTWSHLKS